MNAELPPFRHGKHNSECVSTIDRGLRVILGYGACHQGLVIAIDLLMLLTLGGRESPVLLE